MRRLVFSLTLLALLCAGPLAQKAAVDPAPLAKAKAACAVEVARFAEWCVRKKLKTEATAALAEAEKLDPAGDEVARAKAKLAKLEGTPAEDAAQDLAKERASAGKKIAPLYAAIIAEYPDNQLDPLEAALRAAYGWHVELTDRWVETEWPLLQAAKRYARLHRVLSVAAELAPTGTEKKQLAAAAARQKALQAAEAVVSVTTPLLKKCTGHEMMYYLSLPEGWTADKDWPVLVAVEGAGCNFYGACTSYSGKDNTTYIVVTPHTFSNTNEILPAKYKYSPELCQKYQRGGRLDFDDPGIQAAMVDLRKTYNAREKFFITGFSGGGNACWRFTLCHPEMLVASSPNCANFAAAGPETKAPERETLPVKAFQGEKDEYLAALNMQWENAKAEADRRGFKNVTRVMVPEAGHGVGRKLILDFFAEHLPKPDAKPAKAGR